MKAAGSHLVRPSLWDAVLGLVKDPPPEFAFEVGAGGIAMSRTQPLSPKAGSAGRQTVTQFARLAPGVIVPSPVKENVINAAEFAQTIASLVPPSPKRVPRTAAVILPDNSVRIVVLDFDQLPKKQEELRGLIQFRLRKSVPFDVDEASLSWVVQKGGRKILAAVAPVEVVTHYEAAFRSAGLQPGLVTVSSLAMLDLLPATGSVVVARRSPGVLTVFALDNGVVTLARALELRKDAAPGLSTEGLSTEDLSREELPGQDLAGEDLLEEIASDVYPTLAYIEDQTGKRPERLIIAGFGSESESASIRLAVDLDLAVDAMEEAHPGLAGYLASLAAQPQKAAA